MTVWLFKLCHYVLHIIKPVEKYKYAICMAIWHMMNLWNTDINGSGEVEWILAGQDNG